ncbi:hypothetical protein LOTGIDRAFT_175322 [Lottia gigantea]|uniref:EGF-like domain-containing protein n=1 Tax=Lottia gigantea TaxID=225164 RepID=V3ZTV7_LOTGI|nr:hypothetical protein LOTGIDRAFT_175322 [Lottia gigantea]ESO94883.1 hypothetical protein LOTGIDRAFT_175322 [Lottia gigantea]
MAAKVSRAYFGVDDFYDCHCVNDEQCEKITGSCINGCSEKYSGPSCQKQCNVGTYGSDCSNFCYCLHNVGCSDDGVCPSGCLNGWQGPHCNIGQICKEALDQIFRHCF